MRRSVLRSLGAAAVLISAAQGTRAQLAEEIVDQIKAGVPVVGVDVGASIPIGNFQESAKPGGAIAPFVGYQIGDGSFNGLTFTPISNRNLPVSKAAAATASRASPRSPPAHASP